MDVLELCKHTLSAASPLATHQTVEAPDFPSLRLDTLRQHA